MLGKGSILSVECSSGMGNEGSGFTVPAKTEPSSSPLKSLPKFSQSCRSVQSELRSLGSYVLCQIPIGHPSVGYRGMICIQPLLSSTACSFPLPSSDEQGHHLSYQLFGFLALANFLMTADWLCHLQESYLHVVTPRDVFLEREASSPLHTFL